MNERLISAYVVAQYKMLAWKETAVRKVKDAFTDETGDVNVVAIVVLIGVAVGLALFFKDEIAGLLSKLFGDIESGTSGFTDKANGSAGGGT